MLEVVLCLALFSAVLYVAQRQSSAQWQFTQQANEQRKHTENQQKQASMVQLTGSVSWLDRSQDTHVQIYPDCQRCSGDDLTRWFQASLHPLPKSAVMTSKKEAEQ
ncbi:hypothetical protein DFP75_102208 [Marinomonas alcarazii]|uniref:Uncharacterized protein n=2 Tax=Marinomonas alcarazii TaxID=491949 RepID=A0A318V6K4_9GAMM|nr:hypothetical protein DFP75_102208 [Marinomonas alcarazii]